jgi:hypothetical protein
LLVEFFYSVVATPAGEKGKTLQAETSNLKRRNLGVKGEKRGRTERKKGISLGEEGKI